MNNIGVLGSVAIDNIFEADSIPVRGQRVFGRMLGRYVGGIAANQAVEMARYLDGVHLLGAVGSDEAGETILGALAARNVCLDRIERSQDLSGQSFMYLTDGKQDYFSIVTPETNHRLDARAVCRQLAGLDALLVSLEVNPEAPLAALRAAKQAGIVTYLNPSPVECCTDEMLALADVVILNRREAKLLFGISGDTPEREAEELRAVPGGKTILMTKGGGGALLLKEGTVFCAPALAVTVRDTIGAGDALIGAYIGATERGCPPYQALSFGCIAGSLTASVVGAQSSTHDWATLEQIYLEQYERREDKTI